MTNEKDRQAGEEIVESPSTGTVPPVNSSATPRVKEEPDEDTRYMTRQEYERARLDQNLPVAVIAGIVAGIACSGIWAAIAVTTSTIHSFMAVLVGLGVGYVVRKAGKGMEMKFGIVAAIIAVISCALGNFLATIGFIASYEGLNFFDVLFNFDYSFMPQIMKEDFEPVDILFYVLAIIAAFGVAYQKVKVEE